MSSRPQANRKSCFERSCVSAKILIDVARSRGDFKKLKGIVEWRLRVGDWRVFLNLDGPHAYVVGMSDRQDAY